MKAVLVEINFKNFFYRSQFEIEDIKVTLYNDGDEFT